MFLNGGAAIDPRRDARAKNSSFRHDRRIRDVQSTRDAAARNIRVENTQLTAPIIMYTYSLSAKYETNCKYSVSLYTIQYSNRRPFRGPRNGAVPDELYRAVQCELNDIVQRIGPSEYDPSQERVEDFVVELASGACGSFSAGEIDRLAEALGNIRGKSISWSQGAYAIFEAPSGGYIQFMSSVDGCEYLCEIASHKYHKPRQIFLTDRAVGVIERAGFLWPRATSNFIRWFPCTNGEDIRLIAAFALGALAAIFRHAPGRQLSQTVHIP